ALDLLAPGSRPAAVPIWNERKRGFLELLHSYGLHGPAARKIAADWTAAIAVAGEAEKQHRRQKREAEIKAVERFFAEEFK
uniref:hypothetical protein n=1 Tax=Cucumibacter marinus TaxID=1121252 RepID=UPI00056D75C4